MDLLDLLLNLGPTNSSILAILVWLLAVYCIWDKWDRKREKGVWVISDIFNAGLVPITLAITVSISLAVAITLPQQLADLSAQRDQALSAELKTLRGGLTSEAEAALQARLDRAGEQINALREERGKLQADLETAREDAAALSEKVRTAENAAREYWDRLETWRKQLGRASMADLLGWRFGSGGNISAQEFDSFAQDLWRDTEWIEGSMSFSFKDPRLQGFEFVLKGDGHGGIQPLP